jgi:SAM-dependent methyltransferase
MKVTMNDRIKTMYAHRFGNAEEGRSVVWKILTRQFFQRWIGPASAVLDLGAGYCEFINNISAARKYALDLNPVTPSKAGADVTVLTHDASSAWPVPANSLDVIFTSNFFEHLENKEALSACLGEVSNALKPGGIFIALGPNIRFCYDVYWDFIDHYIPLSDRSLVEAIELAGLQVEEVISRFLPYTMSGKRQIPLTFVRLYLKLRFVWPVFGKQFLIIARNHD